MQIPGSNAPPKPATTAHTNAVARSDAASPTTPIRKRLNAERIDFKIQFELKGDDTHLGRALNDQGLKGWTASRPKDDCSHGRFDDGGWHNFVRISSRRLRVADGALSVIGKVLHTLQGAGGQLAKSAAMKIYVPVSVLDDEATDRFLKLVAGHEDILFRIGQNGSAGRPLDHKLEYGTSISANVSPSESHTAKDWMGHLGNKGAVNAHTSGWWELRFFDASFNVEAVQASIQLVCGLVAAAVEGRGPLQTAHPPIDGDGAIDRKRWDALLRDTVTPAVGRALERSIAASGYSLPKGITDDARAAITQLIAHGYVFQDAQGKLHASLDALATAVAEDATLRVAAPQGEPFNLRAHGLESFCLGETGALSSLAESTRRRLEDAVALRNSGVELRNAAGESLSAVRVAIADDEEILTAHRTGESLRLDKTFDLQTLAAIESGRRDLVPPQMRPVLATVDELIGYGYTFVDGRQAVGAPAITWPARIASHFVRGDLALDRNGQRTALTTVEALDQKVLLPERKDRLTDAQRERYESGMSLATRGFTFRSGDQAVEVTSAFFVEQAVYDHPDFSVLIHGAQRPTPLPSVRAVDTLLNIELGREQRLDEPTRRTCADIELLRAHGFKFFNGATEGEIKSRSGAILSLQTTGQCLSMQAPDTYTRTLVSAAALHPIAQHVAGKSEAMDAAMQQAVESATQLRNSHFTLSTENAEQPGTFDHAKAPNLLAALATGGTLCIGYPNGGSRSVMGAHAFLSEVGTIKQTATLTDAQRTTLRGLGEILRRGDVGAFDAAARRLNDVELMPWQLAHGGGIKAYPTNGAKLNETEPTAISSWEKLQHFVALESRDTRLPRCTLKLLDQFARMKDMGARFYTVPAARREPPRSIALGSTFADRLEEGGVRVHLPHWTLWNWFPHKNITLHSPSDVDVLAHRVHATAISQ